MRRGGRHARAYCSRSASTAATTRRSGASRPASTTARSATSRSVLIVSRDPAPPPVGYVARSGGMFRDMTIHDFDMARWLLGEEPVEIAAHGSCLVDRAIGEAGDIDTAAVTLRTAGGRLCQIVNSPARRFRLRPAHRGLRRARHAARRQPAFDRRSSARTVMVIGAIPPCPSSSSAMPTPTGSNSTPSCGGCTARPRIIVSGADGIRALELADAADRSMRTGSIVKLEPMHEEPAHRPDRQRLHRPRARDRAPGRRRRVPGDRSAGLRIARGPG